MRRGHEPQALRRPLRDTWPPLVWLALAAAIAMFTLMLAPSL